MTSHEIPSAPSTARVSSRHLALLTAALVGTLCLVELIAAARSYRATIDASHWASLEAALDPELPVVLGTPWLGPVARMHLPALAAPERVGAPDLLGLEAFHIVTARGARIQGADLTTLLDRDGVTIGPAQYFGGLELRRVDVPESLAVLDSLVSAHERHGLMMRSAGAQCQAAGRERGQHGLEAIRCSAEGRSFASLHAGLAEIDLQPRDCLLISVEEGVTAFVEVPRFRFGEQVVLHAGVHDFNARLRSESPFALNLRRDDALLGRWVITDAEGWKPMSSKTTDGEGRLIVELVGGVGGRWEEGKLDRRARRELCLELRSLGPRGNAPTPAGEAAGGER